jgi:hypothetical protein
MTVQRHSPKSIVPVVTWAAVEPADILSAVKTLGPITQIGRMLTGVKKDVDMQLSWGFKEIELAEQSTTSDDDKARFASNAVTHTREEGGRLPSRCVPGTGSVERTARFEASVFREAWTPEEAPAQHSVATNSGDRCPPARHVGARANRPKRRGCWGRGGSGSRRSRRALRENGLGSGPRNLRKLQPLVRRLRGGPSPLRGAVPGLLRVSGAGGATA